MPTLTVTKNYDDGVTLTEAMLDAAFTSIETFLNSTKIDSDNIQSGGVAEASLASSSVTESKLGANAVTSTKLSSDAAIDANRAVQTNHIRDSAVTTAKIADLNVTTGKLAANAVTRAKLAAIGEQVSASSGVASPGGGLTLTDVTNLSVTLTTTGRMVRLMLVSDGSADTAGITNGSGIASLTTIAFVQDATVVSRQMCTIPAGHGKPPSMFSHEYTPAAGTYTYKVQLAASVLGNTVSYVKLVAREL